MPASTTTTGLSNGRLKDCLRQPFSSSTWHETLLPHVFGRDQVKWFPTPVSLEVEARYADKVAGKRQLGVVQLGGADLFGTRTQLAVVEIELTAGKVDIARNRVGLRNMVFNLTGDERADGLLAFFHDPTQPNAYRFSFLTQQSSLDEDTGQVVTTSTHSKRYTYVLGRQEACTTATERLQALATHQPIAELKHVQEAFSVEKLNKEFFTHYKAHYERFWKYLALQHRDIFLPGQAVPEKLVDKEKQEKPIRDFAKKLLGRLVFLHFLQRKGWLGCPSETADWRGGHQTFLLNLFEQFPDKTRFHSQALSELFFRTLNNPNRENYRFQVGGMAKACRVPYLNGGLFDNDDPNTAELDFPVEFFKDLLEFFAQYNFTIDENRPDDHEVGIDPEMLGHIFENLLEENREKGAFYTPREIVQYMCQEALVEHLSRRLQDHNVTRADVVELVQQQNVTVALRPHAKYADELLRDITVCDPAIGSGAFPMGMLQEIFSARRYLFPYLAPGLTFDPVQVKKHIIQHTIHGVDLERGAVDIARLRFWLALVVDEERPQPLPNLDYKIMQGNSLLESFEGIPLHHVKPTHQVRAIYEPRTVVDGGQQLGIFQTSVAQQTRLDLVRQEAQQKQQEELEELLDSYFNVGDGPRKADAPQASKTELRQQISGLIHQHLQYNVELRLNQARIELATAEATLNAIRLDAKDPVAKRLQKEKARAKQQKAVDGCQQTVTRLEDTMQRLDKLQDGVERPYFLWHLYFRDVFEKGGFDIVIGNPPYIQLQKMGADCDLLQQVGYETFTRTGDIYALFYEKGYDMLKPGGCLAYITSNKWLRANYGEKLRTFFVEKTNPLTLLDFNDFQLFENAVLLANIMVLTKEVNQRQTAVCKINRDFKQLRALRPYLETRVVMEAGFSSSSWVVMDGTHVDIKRKVEEQGIRLKDWDIKINYGIKTGFNPAFIISGQKKDELIAEDPKSAEIIRPLLRGRDVDPYLINFADQWLINTYNGKLVDQYNSQTRQYRKMRVGRVDAFKDYPAIYQHLLSFGDEIKDRQDQGEHWTNLRNCAYAEDFAEPKIIYPNMTSVLPFVYDKGAFYTNQKCFIITGERLGYLTAFFNSKLFRFCFKSNFPELPGVTRELSKVFFDQIPVTAVTDEQEKFYLEKVEYIQEAKKKGLDTKWLEEEIENKLADDYKLTPDERAVVLASTD